MMLSEFVDIQDKRVCHICIQERFLKDEIERSGTVTECSYCVHKAPTSSIELVAERVQQAIESHFYLTDDSPTESEWRHYRDSDKMWHRTGKPVIDVISDLLLADDQIAEDIRRFLEEDVQTMDDAISGFENPFCEEAHYDIRPPNSEEWDDEWDDFKTSIKTSARYFNRSGEKTLKKIFGDLANHFDQNGNPVLEIVGPGKKMSSLYRARVFQSREELKESIKANDFGIGPPQAKLATAGRMNAHGISVFYGSDNPEIAMAEVRPPVGSHVLLAKFHIIRELCLLDLGKLGDIQIVGSELDPDFSIRIERASFLRSLEGDLTKAVLKNDEAIDYLPTQVIADYLSNLTDINIDGIIFRSVQSRKKGKNVVLFHKSSMVERCLEDHQIETVSSLVEAGEFFEHVDKIKFSHKRTPPNSADRVDMDFDLSKYIEGYRTPSLRIDIRSFFVYNVNGVEISASSKRLEVMKD